MQSAVAANIAYITASELGHDMLANYGWKLFGEAAEIDPLAFKHWVNGFNEYRKFQIGEGGNLATRIQFFENAIEVDPSFYQPYVGLANANLGGHWASQLPLQTARPAARAAIIRAMELRPGDSWVQTQLAFIHLALDLDYAQSKAFLERMLQVQPGDAWDLYFLANIDLREGRVSDALRRLVDVDDAAKSMQGDERAALLGFSSILRCSAGDCEGALSDSEQAMKLVSAGDIRALALMARILGLLTLGNVEEVKPWIDEAWRLNGHISPERYIYAFAMIGEMAKARDILADSRYELTHHFFLALGHLALGDIDKTFTAIEAGIEEHDRMLIESMPVAAWWDPIRDDPRFNEMLALLDAKVTHTEQYLKDHKISPAAQ